VKDGGVTKMVVDTNGRVGIGKTNPSALLQITNGDTFVDNGQLYISNTANDTRTSIRASDGQFLTFEAFNAANDTKRNIVINPYGGNVGIGTTNPLRKLHVNGELAIGNGGAYFPLPVHSMPMFACRAWGVIRSGTVLASGNCSINLSGQEFVVTFTVPMPDTSYAVIGSCQSSGVSSAGVFFDAYSFTTTVLVFRVLVGVGGGVQTPTTAGTVSFTCMR
jgi:hypothetical protein